MSSVPSWTPQAADTSIILLMSFSAPSTISKTPSCLFRKFFKTYTKAAFLLLKILINVYDLPINRLHHKIWHLLYGLTVVNYRWSKAINLNLRSFILMNEKGQFGLYFRFQFASSNLRHQTICFTHDMLLWRTSSKHQMHLFIAKIQREGRVCINNIDQGCHFL
jgi:hypothetical protein